MKKILMVLAVLVAAGAGWAATYDVAYGICNGGPADFKTGTPTITISGDTAIFSEAQTNVLMGVGALITYNTTSRCFVKPFGKISTTKWLVTTSTGTQPSAVSDQTVNSIKHPFASLSAVSLGYNGATFLNNASMVATDVNMWWACYAEQSTYTKDSTAIALTAVSGDSTHRLYIFSPSNTSTECNLSMFPTSAKYDSTKYRLITNNTTSISRNTTQTELYIYNLQIWSNKPSAPLPCFTAVTLSGEINRISRCILLFSGPDSGVTAASVAILHNTGSVGTIILDNNLIIGTKWKGTNSGQCFRNLGTGSIAYVYENTIVGQWAAAMNKAAGTTVSTSNNFYGEMNGAIAAGITKDYDVYRTTNEGETNGTLTTQTYAQLITDTTPANRLNWNFTPIVGSDLIGNGTALDAAYSLDLLHGIGWRPKLTTWDAGALEYEPAIGITSISHVAGDRYTINGTGFKPSATCPTVTVGDSAATVDSCSASVAYVTLRAGTPRGDQIFSLTNSVSENDTMTGYVYTYPVLTSMARVYGAKYKLYGNGLKPSSAPTITIGGISAVVDTSWSDSVKITLGTVTPRDTQNIVLTNSDTYKDTLRSKIYIGDHAINILTMGQSNMAGSDTGTGVSADSGSYNWKGSNNTWTTPANDPQYSNLNNSIVPELCNYLLNDYADVGDIHSAYAGKGVVDWLNDRNPANPFDLTTVYGKAVTYARNAGGIDHILCWFGEDEIISAISADSLTRSFNRLMAYFRQDLAGYITDTCPVIFIAPHADQGYAGVLDSNVQKVRDAFTSLHNPDSNRYLAGYATMMNNFDNIHADETGLSKSAWMFYRAIKYSHGDIDYCLGPRFASMRYGLTRDTVIITVTKDSPDIVPALGAKGFRVQNGADTIVVNKVDIAGDEIKLSLASPITVLHPRIGYLNKSNPPLDSLVHYDDSLIAYLEPTPRAFETSDITLSDLTVASGNYTISDTALFADVVFNNSGDTVFVAADLYVMGTFSTASDVVFVFTNGARIIMPDCTLGTTNGNSTVVLTYPANCTNSRRRGGSLRINGGLDLGL